MSVYLYALADRIGEVADIAGVRGEPLTVLQAGPAQVIASVIDAAPPLDRASLETQDRVVRRLHERADALLPMRFGTVKATADDAIRAVAAMAAGLNERFARVRGREQMTLRVLLSADDAGSVAAAADHLSVPVEKPRSGAEYLRALARQEAPPEAAPLLAAAAGLERATQIVRARQGQVITIYQLIDRGAADRYRTRVAAAAERLAGVNVHISGPAPPYAFAQ